MHFNSEELRANYAATLDHIVRTGTEGFTDQLVAFRNAALKLGVKGMMKCSHDIGINVMPLATYVNESDFPKLCASMGKAILPLANLAPDDIVLQHLIRLCCPSSVEHAWIDRAIFMARWYQYGCPTLKVSTEQTAALCMSDIQEEVLLDINMPWHAVLIELPPEAFPVKVDDYEIMGISQKDQSGNCRYISAIQFKTKYDLIKSGTAKEPLRRNGAFGIALYVHGTIIETMSLQAIDVYKEVKFPPINNTSMLRSTVDLETLEKRALSMGGRLVLNSALAVAEHGTLHKAPSKKRKGKKSRFVPTCQQKEYVLGAPVRFDVTPALHAYLSGDKETFYKVRWCVRGHWRNQACGPKLAEHRRTWIMPYMKGHKEAPLNIKDYILGEDKEEKAEDAVAQD